MKIKNINTGFIYDLEKKDALRLLKSQPYDFESLEKVEIKKDTSNLTDTEKSILGINDGLKMSYEDMLDFIKKNNIAVENKKKETLAIVIEDYLKNTADNDTTNDKTVDNNLNNENTADNDTTKGE